MLVAPVLDKGQTKRDIFIPNGRWLDTLNNKEIEGKIWLKDFQVELNQVPAFVKVK